jgi:hypothetical protein
MIDETEEGVVAGRINGCEERLQFVLGEIFR